PGLGCPHRAGGYRGSCGATGWDRGTLSKFPTDTELCGVADTLREGMCHPEGPGQAGEVGLCKPHGVQQGQGQGPAHGLGQSQAQTQAGRGGDGEQPQGEGPGGISGWKTDCEPAMCARSPESHPCAGLHPEQCEQQGEGGDSPPLLRSRETPPAVLGPVLGAPT
ncbi:unnamed protein product, partial [Bubo scandiacus]